MPKILSVLQAANSSLGCSFATLCVLGWPEHLQKFCSHLRRGFLSHPEQGGGSGKPGFDVQKKACQVKG
jgi:hypothetical protein